MTEAAQQQFLLLTDLPQLFSPTFPDFLSNSFDVRHIDYILKCTSVEGQGDTKRIPFL